MPDSTLLPDLKRTLASGTDAQRLVMLARLTDLFLSGADRFTSEQIMLFDELLTDFVSTVDTNARARLAAQLAPVANAPVGVIRTLAFDNRIEVARPVLRLSSVLADVDLVANATTKSQQHLLAISQRRSLSEAVTDVLVTQGDSQVARAVAGNANAQLSFAGMRTLVRRAKNDDDLTLVLGSRRDMPRQHMLRLLDAASDKVRARLRAQSAGPIVVRPKPSAASEVSSRGDIGADTGTDIGMGPFNYTVARPKVEAMQRAGQLNEAAFIAFADNKRVDELVVGLSLFCDIDIDVIEHALLAPSLEILLIVVKLAKLSRGGAKALIQLKAPQLGLSPSDIEDTLDNLNRLNVGNARAMLGFYRTMAHSSTIRRCRLRPSG